MSEDVGFVARRSLLNNEANSAMTSDTRDEECHARRSGVNDILESMCMI